MQQKREWEERKQAEAEADKGRTAKHTPMGTQSGSDLVPWERAEQRAMQLMAELGVKEHECRCTITPTSYGWRVVVQRLTDATTRTARVTAQYWWEPSRAAIAKATGEH